MKVYQLQEMLSLLPPDQEIILETDIPGPDSPRLLRAYTATGAKYYQGPEEQLEVDLQPILVLVPGEAKDGVVIFPE